jgi:tRNA threonylcarbamoyladenosine biosynthesis protein TsaE
MKDGPDTGPGGDGDDGVIDAATVETDGPEQTARVAERLSRGLMPGDLVLLEGEVGAGKSTFVRAAIRELGVEGPIPSPTFTIGRRYLGRLPASHLDLYRLGPLSEEVPELLGEYLDPSGVTFVEWPGDEGEVIRSGSKREIRVEIDHLGRDARRITIHRSPDD